jgi:hypothetical protein
MAIKIDVPPNHPLRDRHWRPPNPSWASEETIARVRAALWRVDSRLDVWWYTAMHQHDREHPGRWAIMYWKQKANEWSVVFFWEGVGGSFRPLSEEAVTPIKNALGACEEEANVAAKRCEEENRLRKEKDKAEFRESVFEYENDKRARNFGSRLISAPGYIRRRNVKPEDSQNSNHNKFLKERGLNP